MAFFQAGLRRAAVQASKAPVCGLQCLWQPQKQQLAQMLARPEIRCSSLSTQSAASFAFRQRIRNTTPFRSCAIEFAKPALPVRPLSTAATASSASVSAQPTSIKTSSFPETSSKAVAYWLIASAVSVFGIVVWGGLTRLTESGLSITEWRPVTGALPPRSEADWEVEFTKYRASPEYARLNPNMTVEEFKKIYFMEWAHRVWGRLIGLTFVVPAVYFVVRRRVSTRMAWHLFGIASLIGFQGFIGWWMVSSGLRDELFAKDALPPRVSQYRLTTHLATAFACYSWMLLAGLSILRNIKLRTDPAAGVRLANTLALPALRPFRLAVAALTALVFVTAMSGGLVAGLDAGLIYNEFPMMGTGLAPPHDELWDPHYSRKPDRSDLWWRNMLENPSLVQLDHRILATTTFFSVLALFFYARTGRIAAVLPHSAKRGTTGAVHLVLLQAALGISTLIYMVPTHLAATHQAGSLALLTGILVLGHRLHIPASSLRMIQRHLANAAKPNVGSGVITKR